jgi:cytoskeletal protein CcmA (bactofilin family)
VVTGDVVARDITVSGVVNGTLLAKEVVDVRTTANVTGRIVSMRLILHDGATFHGDVEPQQVEAAMTVARHRRK